MRKDKQCSDWKQVTELRNWFKEKCVVDNKNEQLVLMLYSIPYLLFSVASKACLNMVLIVNKVTKTYYLNLN